MLELRLLTFCFIVIAICHNPHKFSSQLTPTLVTAWWPQSDQKQSLPIGNLRQQFQKLLALPINLIIFGDKNLAAFVASKRQDVNTKFFQLNTTVLTDSWYFSRVKQLTNSGQKVAEDSISPILAYSRMFLLNRAYENDAFYSDEFIWVDIDALASYQIAAVLQPKNVNSMLLAFRHHFFILTTPKDSQVHAYPNAQKTYFSTKFDTFVTAQLFGGKRDAIPTMALIYQDLLRVAIQFDGNLWSEDALWSLLADRCPFLISYLSTDDIKPPQARRLLPEQGESVFQKEKRELDEYEWMIGMCEMGIILVAVLFAIQIIKFIKNAKCGPNRNIAPQNNLSQSNMELKPLSQETS